MMQINASELTALASELGEKAGEVRRTVSRPLRDAARAIVRTQRELVERRSDATRDTISAVTPSGAPLHAFSLEAIIGPETWYARFAERRRPFVSPSPEPHMDRLEDETGAAVEALLKR